MEYITIPETRIPVILEADVVVVGGGPAGFGAAVQAARNGADTVVIERFGSPGGIFTNGSMCITVGDPPEGLPAELFEKLKDGGYTANPLEKFPDLPSNSLYHYEGFIERLTAFDSDMTACVMNEMLEESGVKIMFRNLFVDTKVEDKTIKAVIVENASGRQAVVGKLFIDATGRGDVVARSGAPFKSAGNTEGLPIPPGLMWKMNNVDYEKLFEYQKEDPKLTRIMEKAKEKGRLPSYLPKKTDYYGSSYTGHPRLEMCPTMYHGEMLLWTPAVHEWGLDCAESAEDLTLAETYIRKQIVSELNFLKEYVPGFEKARLSGVAPFMGIREGRHPIGEYVMSYDDIKNQRRFDDAALRLTAPDHGHSGDGDRFVTFDIPYGSFLAGKVSNLLLAGDNISMEHKAILHIRGFGTAVKTGAVSGAAAALSLKDNVMPVELKWNIGMGGLEKKAL